MSLTDQVVAFTAREQAELVAVGRNDAPLGPDEVAGPTLATVISSGTELQGAYLGEHFPAYPGYAAAFRAEQVGDGVTAIQPGDVVYAIGGHRSWQRVAQAGALVAPAGLDPCHVPFARLSSVSWTTLITTSARPPAKVIVSGLGVIGHLAAQVFRAAGYQVLGVDPNESRREFAAGQGLAVAAAVPLDDPAWVNHVRLVVECSGHEDAVVAACRVVAKGGEVAMVGVPWRRRSDTVAFDLLHAVFHRYVHLRSGWEWEIPRGPQEFVAGTIRDNNAGALEWLADGRITVDGLYRAVAPAACQEAYQALLHQEPGALAYVFDWTQG